MKTLIITAFLTTLFFSSPAQLLTDSLLLYYSMDGNCLDMSGNGFDGTVNADLTADRNGNSNSAYHFNGINQYINWPYSTELQPPLPVSFAFWVKFDNIDYTTGGIFNTNFIEDDYSGLFMSVSGNDELNVSFCDATGGIGPSSRRTITGNTSLQSNTWYFVIAIVRGPTDMTLLVNCENDGGTYSGSGGNLGYLPVSGTLGRVDGDMYAPAYQLGGTLDEFRFWNRALTTTDIESLCTMTDIADIPMDKTGLYPNPAAEYLSFNTVPENAVRADIVSLTGSIILSTDMSSSVFVGNLQSGFYFIRVYDQNNNLVATKSFIKN